MARAGCSHSSTYSSNSSNAYAVGGGQASHSSSNSFAVWQGQAAHTVVRSDLIVVMRMLYGKGKLLTQSYVVM